MSKRYWLHPPTKDPEERRTNKVPVLDELFHALYDYGRRRGPRYVVHGVYMGPDKWCEFQDAMAKDGRQCTRDGYRVFGARVMMSTAHGDGITVF